MKKVLVTVVVFSILILLNGEVLAFQNEPADFRGIRWGTIIADIADMGPAKDPGKGDERFFLKKGEVLQIDNVEVESIEYGFYKNRFFTVVIRYKTDTHFKKLQGSLEKQYGTSKKANPLFEQYTWDGENVRVENSYSARTGTGHINYYYKPLLLDKKKDQLEEKAKKRRERDQGHESEPDVK